MIGSLRGTVSVRDDTELLVEVGGVGYRVQVAPHLAATAAVGDELFVHVHHHRRDDAEVLYGFATLEERRVFETLIGTHGVGPALGQAILAVHPPATLAEVVATEDVAALCLVPGVGRKTAARLLVELSSRLSVASLDLSSIAGRDGAAAGSARAEVREALVGLGYGDAEIARALSELDTTAGGDAASADTSELLRAALQRLAAV